MIHPNGAEDVYVNGTLDHIRYNTGDVVWFRWDGNQYVVIAIKTHDGIEWGLTKI